MATALALVPHPEYYWGRDEPELIDERTADRLAIAYVEGAYNTIERVFGQGLRNGRHAWLAMQALRKAYMPRYAELRDYLAYECNAPLVLAARIALRRSYHELA